MSTLFKLLDHARVLGGRARNHFLPVVPGLATVPCACGADAYRKVFAFSGGRSSAGGEVARCDACGLARTLPVPDVGMYANGYGDSTTAGGTYLEREKPWCAEVARDALRVLGEAGLPAEARLLDVGCNGGELVAELRLRGGNAEGCDVDPVAVRHGQGKGLPLQLHDFSRGPLGGAWDAVLMNHTLEHVGPLSPFLDNLAASLRPGGWLYVRVPNFEGLLAELLSPRWSFLVPDEHVWHFTPRTLARTVSSLGQFRTVHVRAATSLERGGPGLLGTARARLGWLGERVGRGDELCALFQRGPDAAASR